MARLTNRCKGADHEDLPYYIKESASTVGIKPEGIGMDSGSITENAKTILSFVIKEIVEMKKLRSENSLALTSSVLS